MHSKVNLGRFNDGKLNPTCGIGGSSHSMLPATTGKTVEELCFRVVVTHPHEVWPVMVATLSPGGIVVIVEVGVGAGEMNGNLVSLEVVKADERNPVSAVVVKTGGWLVSAEVDASKETDDVQRPEAGLYIADPVVVPGTITITSVSELSTGFGSAILSDAKVSVDGHGLDPM